MKTAIIVMIGLALGAAGASRAQMAGAKPAESSTAQPLSDADARKVRDLQLRAIGAKLVMAETRRQWEEAQRELDAAESELRQLFLVLRQRYHCPDCDLDRNLIWLDGAPSADPIPVGRPKGNQKAPDSGSKADSKDAAPVPQRK